MSGYLSTLSLPLRMHRRHRPDGGHLMRVWLHKHRERLVAVGFTSLLFAILLGAMFFQLRRPQPAPIVISAVAPPPKPTAAATITPLPIRVYVSGAVLRPGVYALPWDSRVEDAVVAAGGGADDADLSRVNLALRLRDEQQIYVPGQAEALTPALPTAPPPTSSTDTSGISGRKININTASAAELEALPGIGPVLAQRIIDHRQANGPFGRLEDIKKVKGIGDKTFEHLKDLIATE